MNNNKINNLIEHLYSVKMTEQENTTMQKNLLAFTRSYKSVESPYAPFVLHIHKAFTLAIIAVLTIGSISQPASAGALPGELLYPVKIIHEEIASATKNSPEKKINHEIKRAEKRIQEATILSERKNLNNEEQEGIAKSIKKHTDKVKEGIEEVKKEDPQKALELNTQLKNTLKENVEILKVVVETKENNDRLNEEESSTIKEADEPVSEDNETINNEIPLEEIVTEEVVDSEEELEPIVDESETLEEETPIEEVVIEEEVVSEEESIAEENILLNIIEENIEDAEVVSQKVQKDIDNEEEVVIEEVVITVSEEDLAQQQQVKLLETIVGTENELELINAEILSLIKDGDSLPQDSAAVTEKRSMITELISEKKYDEALIILEELLVIKKEVRDSYLQEDIVSE